MNLTEYDIMKKTRNILNEAPVKLYLCTVNSVNEDAMTAEVSLPGIASTIRDVPILGFARSGDSGIITMPTENSIGFLAITAKKHNVLLGTISSASSAQIAEKLFQGEMLYQSPGGAYVKLDRKGNVLIGNSSNGLLLMDSSGNVSAWSENANLSTVSQKISSGILNGHQGVKEEIFVGQTESEDTLEQLIDKIIRDDDVFMISPLPCIIIEKGTVVDAEGNVESLPIHDDPLDDLEMVMRIKIVDPVTGQERSGLAFDVGGNVKMYGNKLHLDFNTVKTTYVTKIDDPVV